MREKIAFLLLVLLTESFTGPIPSLIWQLNCWSDGKCPNTLGVLEQQNNGGITIAEAKGVAGLGKAGGDSQGGSDKGGQQVPPEVYIALTYAGTAFLFTLSVPLILYGLNKLLNKIEDCFGCGPSSKKEKQRQAEQEKKLVQEVGGRNDNNDQTKPSLAGQFTSINGLSHQNQQLHLQLQQQDPTKFNQQLPFTTLMTNGNSSRGNNASNNFSEPNDNHHIQSNSRQTSGYPSPAQNGADSCVINFTPFENDMNCAKTASRTSNSSVSNSSHRHPNLQTIQLQQRQQQQQQPFIISSPNM